MELLIRATEDLAALRTSAGRRAVRRIRLGIDTHDPTLATLVADVNSGLRTCGCFAAAIFCLAALATLPWLVALMRARSAYGGAALVALAFGYVVGIAFLGKLSGLLIGHWRLRRNLNVLARRLTAAAGAERSGRT